MTTINKRMLCKIIIISIAFLQFVKPFIFFDVSKLTFILGILLFFSSITIMGESFKRTAAIFFTLGTALLLFSDSPTDTLIKGTSSMQNIVAILVIMQLFTIPIKAGRYDQSIEYFLFNNLKSKSGLYLFTMGITHIFASFLLFGTIPVMLSLLGDSIKKRVDNYKQFICTSLSRSYALVVLWAPGAVNVLLVLQATGSKWVDIFLPAISLSFLGLATSYFLERKLNITNPDSSFEQDGSYTSDIEPQEARNKIIHIFLVVLSLILITALLESISFASSTNRIMIAGLSVVITWYFACIGNKNIKYDVLEYWNTEVSKNLDLATLFVSMGVFAEAIGSVGLLHILEKLLSSYGSQIGIYILLITPIVIIICSIIGIHPFISLVILGKILSSLTLPFSNVALALSLGVGGVISYTVSPFAGLILTLSKFIDCSSRQISLKWNGLFSMIYLIEALIFIYIYNMFIY